MVPQRQSDRILQMLDSAQQVEDSVTVHGPIVAPILDQRFAPRTAHLEDGQKPDFLTTMYALRDELGASREGLSSIEVEHIDLKQQITDLSIEREQLFDELEEDYTWLRGVFAKRLGDRKAGTAGLQGPTAQKSTKLLRQVKVVVHKLSKPGLELPDSLLAFGFDPLKTAAELKDKAKRFRKVLKRLRLLRRKSQTIQLEKDRMVAEHRTTFLAVSRTLEGFYRLAGRDDLADRIRPSEVQRGRRAVEVEEEPEEGDSTDGQTGDGQTGDGQTGDGQTGGASDGSAVAQSADPASGSPDGASDGSTPEGASPQDGRTPEGRTPERGASGASPGDGRPVAPSSEA